jgi:hypothetical protein
MELTEFKNSTIQVSIVTMDVKSISLLVSCITECIGTVKVLRSILEEQNLNEFHRWIIG